MSSESMAILKLWLKIWKLSDAAQLILYMQVLFQKFVNEEVPISEVLQTFHLLYDHMKVKGWFPNTEVLWSKSSLLI